MAIGMKIASKFDDAGVKAAGKAIGDFGSGLKKIAGLLAAAFAIDKIKDFAVEAVQAAEGVQVANNRLEAVAKSMNLFGESTGTVTARMIEFAESQEMLVAVDAEVLKATQAQLLTFANLAATADETGGMFDRATIAAADMAAVFGGTADQNAIKLGKALQDPIKGISALTRVGVTFSDEQKTLIARMVESNNVLGAQELILGAIETQVGGAAEATATASEKMQLAFDNVKESVGAALLPVFEDLTETMLPLIDKIAPELQAFFEAMSPYIGDAVEAFGELAEDALPVVTDALDKGAQAFEDIQNFLAPLSEEGGALDGFKNIVEGMEEPLGQVVGFLTTLGETVLTQVNDIISSPEFQEAVVALAEGFGGVAEQLDRLLKQEITKYLIDLTGPAVVGGLDFLNFQLERLETVMMNINDILSGTEVDFIEKMRRLAVIFGFAFEAGVIGDYQNFNAPKEENFRPFAEGGIVRPTAGGTRALLAERGESEVVLPLSKLPGLISDIRGGGAQYVININAGVGSDPVAIGRYVTDAIKRYENVSGKVFARA